MRASDLPDVVIASHDTTRRIGSASLQIGHSHAHSEDLSYAMKPCHLHQSFTPANGQERRNGKMFEMP